MVSKKARCIMHDVRIVGAGLAVLIVCHQCPEKDSEAGYEWHDEDGDVYFDSNKLEDLVRFLEVHPRG